MSPAARFTAFAVFGCLVVSRAKAADFRPEIEEMEQKWAEAVSA